LNTFYSLYRKLKKVKKVLNHQVIDEGKNVLDILVKNRKKSAVDTPPLENESYTDIQFSETTDGTLTFNVRKKKTVLTGHKFGLIDYLQVVKKYKKVLSELHEKKHSLTQDEIVTISQKIDSEIKNLDLFLTKINKDSIKLKSMYSDIIKSKNLPVLNKTNPADKNYVAIVMAATITINDTIHNSITTFNFHDTLVVEKKYNGEEYKQTFRELTAGAITPGATTSTTSMTPTQLREIPNQILLLETTFINKFLQILKAIKCYNNIASEIDKEYKRQYDFDEFMVYNIDKNLIDKIEYPNFIKKEEIEEICTYMQTLLKHTYNQHPFYSRYYYLIEILYGFFLELWKLVNTQEYISINECGKNVQERFMLYFSFKRLVLDYVETEEIKTFDPTFSKPVLDYADC